MEFGKVAIDCFCILYFSLESKIQQLKVPSNCEHVLLIALITIHLMAVVIHKLFFNDNLLKKIL